MQALVEEMNRYNENIIDALSMLNFEITASDELYEYVITNPAYLAIRSRGSKGQVEGVVALTGEHELYFDAKLKQGDPDEDEDYMFESVNITFDDSMFVSKSDDGNTWVFRDPETNTTITYSKTYKNRPQLKDILGIK